MVCVKQTNCIEMSSILCRTLGPLVLSWAPNPFILGAQLAPGGKMLVCIPVMPLKPWQPKEK